MKKIKGHFWWPSRPSRPVRPIKFAFNFISYFILEIPLKINDIKKINALQFYKRNPFKTEQTKKIKKGEFFAKGPFLFGEIWRSTFSMIFKKSYQQGVFDFFYPDPQLAQIFKPTRNLSGQFFLYIQVYMGIMFIIS